jgi:thiamine biosynthesis protein ThiS
MVVRIILNGESYLHRGEGALLSLLEEQKAVPEQVAVMVNDRIVPRADFQRTMIQSGDRVEILSFAGGG